MTATPIHRFTSEDLLTMPDDGRRYELIDGELLVSPAPLSDHETASHNLYDTINDHVRLISAGLVRSAPYSVWFSDESDVQPDVLFIRQDRVGALMKRRGIFGSPDLIVEIISPSSRQTDTVLKFDLYERYGVPEYWIADPARQTIAVHALVEGRYQAVPAGDDGRFTSRVLPGLTVEPAAIFALPAGVNEYSD